MSEEAAGGAPPGGPEGRRGKKVVIVLALLGLLVVIAVAALTTAGSQVDRLLDEVGTTLEPVPQDAGPRQSYPETAPDEPGPMPDIGEGDYDDPTEPETGTGVTGRPGGK
jgi:hypothetical protein